MILTYCFQGKHNKVVQVVNMHTAAGKTQNMDQFSLLHLHLLFYACQFIYCETSYKLIANGC